VSDVHGDRSRRAGDDRAHDGAWHISGTLGRDRGE
jgi:hypothetical protein